MEVPGLFMRIAGLAGLFESCAVAFDHVDAYRQYGSSSRQLHTRSVNQKCFLESWGTRAGRVNGKLALEDTRDSTALEGKQRQRIAQILEAIRGFLETIDAHFQSDGSSKMPNLAVPSSGGSPGRRKSPWRLNYWRQSTSG